MVKLCPVSDKQSSCDLLDVRVPGSATMPVDLPVTTRPDGQGDAHVALSFTHKQLESS
jgi:hypothetical protein